MVLEILTILWQSFWGTANAMIQALIELWPALSSLNDMAAIFSPAGTVLVLLGVPIILIPIGVKLIKYAVSKI